MGLKPEGRVDAPLRAVLRCLDVDTGTIVDELRHEAPGGCVPGPQVHQEFTAAHWAGEGLLLQPTHTEVLWVDTARMAVVRAMSHPLFHSVHSAAPTDDGGFVVAAAGNDSVLRFDRTMALSAHTFLRASPFRACFPGVDDFRLADHDDFKPHAFHPNHASEVNGRLWVTCFETREAFVVGSTPADAHDRVALSTSPPHDGRLLGGLLWFTQVDGHVVAVDPQSGHRTLTIDLGALDPSPGLLGWCRGIALVGSRLFVGMTMLRSTRHREVLRWLVRGAAGEKRPTRVLEIDLDCDPPRLLRQFPVGNAAGGTIYSVLAGWPAHG